MTKIRNKNGFIFILKIFRFILRQNRFILRQLAQNKIAECQDVVLIYANIPRE